MVYTLQQIPDEIPYMEWARLCVCVCMCVSNEVRMWGVIRKGRIVISSINSPPPHHVEAVRRLTETVAKIQQNARACYFVLLRTIG